jgi:hypothetical protein
VVKDHSAHRSCPVYGCQPRRACCLTMWRARQRRQRISQIPAPRHKGAVRFQSTLSADKRSRSLRVLASMLASVFKPRTARTRELQYVGLKMKQLETEFSSLLSIPS